jgi:hypothetical protein
MSRRTEKIIERAHKRIAAIREALGAMELLCSGTLLKRMKVCGKPGCRCASDPAARHGPYYEWGHMHEGRLVHRVVSPQQAEVLRGAIANHRSSQEAHETVGERNRTTDGRQHRSRSVGSLNSARQIASKCV